MSNIILYSQPTCPQCRAVHIMLDSKKIKYAEVQDLNIMTSKGIQHTPVLEVDGIQLAGSAIKDYIFKGILPQIPEEVK